MSHNVRIDAEIPFLNFCDCKRGKNSPKKYCEGYGATMCRFISEFEEIEVSHGKGNSENSVERVLKIWEKDGEEKLLVKLKNKGWGKDLKVLTMNDYKKENNLWPVQWYKAYIDACVVVGGRYGCIY